MPSRAAGPVSCRGFTLMELLVVILVLAMLMGVLLPGVHAVRERARITACAANLKQLAQSCNTWYSLHDSFPSASVTRVQLSWRVFILPYMGQQAIYDRIDTTTAGEFYGGPNREGPDKSVHALNRIDGYQCPAATRIFAEDPTSTLLNPTRKTYNSHYYAVAGPKGTYMTGDVANTYPWVNVAPYGGYCETGLMYRDSKIRADDCGDGLSGTFMIGEIAIRYTPSTWIINGRWFDWAGGGDGGNWVRGGCCGQTPTGTAGSKNVDVTINAPPLIINDAPFSSFHPCGALFALGDGAVKFINENIDVAVYKGLCSRNSGEINRPGR